MNSIAPEDLQEVEKERRNIRYGGRIELIKRLCEIYGDRFIRRQYDVSEKAVDEKLPVRELPREQKSVQKQIQQEQQRQTQPEKKEKKGRLGAVISCINNATKRITTKCFVALAYL